MGSGSSRPTIPAYPAAKARYPTRDFKEIVSGYDRISENSVLTMNKFESYFPKDGKQYSHLLFIALKCGNRNQPKQLRMEEFVQGYTMLCNGSSEELASFCFDIFDPNHSQKIHSQQFHHGLSAICDAAFAMDLPLFHSVGSTHIPTKEEHQKLVDNASQKAMGGLSHLNFEHFTKWILTFTQITEYIKYSIDKIILKNKEMSLTMRGLLIQAPLMIMDDKSLLSKEEAIILRTWLPEPYCKCHLYNVFSTKSTGYSLATLFRNHETKPEQIMKDPSILIIKDTDGNIFGGFLAEAWYKNAERFYGSEESFMFSLYPEKKVYRCTGEDNHVMYSTPQLLAMGGKLNYFGIQIDEELVSGKSHSCVTFGTPRFSNEEVFKIDSVQLWGLIDVPNTKFLFNIDSDDELDIEILRQKEVAGPSIWDMEESWVLDEIKGVGYSKNLAPPPEFSDGEEQTEEQKKKKKLIMPLG